jgi:membrane-associated protease RseP (regulator of RpoE activity)
MHSKAGAPEARGETMKKIATWVLITIVLLVIAAVSQSWAETTGDDKVINKGRVKVIVKSDTGEEPQVYVWEGDEDAPEGMKWVGQKVKRGFLGVGLIELSDELRAHFGAPEEVGVLVSQLVDDGPAAKAGVRVGDVIVSIDGKPTSHAGDIARAIGDLKEGEVVALDVYRDRRLQTLRPSITIREKPSIDMLALPQFDLGELGQFPNPGASGYAFSTGDLSKFAEEWRKRLDDPKFREQMKQFSDRRGQVEQRMKLLEERLRELEERLKQYER